MKGCSDVYPCSVCQILLNTDLQTLLKMNSLFLVFKTDEFTVTKVLDFLINSTLKQRSRECNSTGEKLSHSIW